MSLRFLVHAAMMILLMQGAALMIYRIFDIARGVRRLGEQGKGSHA